MKITNSNMHANNMNQINKDFINTLKSGDTIRAKVIEASPREVTLKTSDGTQFNATLSKNFEGNVGEFLNFSVDNVKNGQLFLTALPKVGKGLVSIDGQLANLLTQMGLPTTSENLEVAKDLLYNKLPVTPENISNILSSVKSINDASSSKITFLMSNNIEIADQNIKSLNQLVDKNLKISTQLDKLIQNINNIQDNSLKTSIQKSLNSITIDSNQSPKDTAPLPQNNSQEISSKPTNTQATTQLNPQNISLDSEKVLTLVKSSLNLANMPSENSPALTKNLADFIVKNLDLPQDRLLSAIKSNFPVLDKLNPPITESALKPLLSELLKLLPTDDVMSKNNTLSEGKNISNVNTQSLESLKDSFQELFIKVSKDLKGEQLNPNEHYKMLLSKLNVLRTLLDTSSVPNKTELLSQVDNLENNIKFLNDINSNSTFIQIPLNLNNSTTTGELFILKKGSKKKKIDPENTTLYLALDTENLGQINTLVKIDKKTIIINLKLESQKILDFVKDHYVSLYEKLDSIDYKLIDIKYKLIDESNITVDNAQKNLTEEIENEYQKIDFKI
jgi:hypothetical protein